MVNLHSKIIDDVQKNRLYYNHDFCQSLINSVKFDISKNNFCDIKDNILVNIAEKCLHLIRLPYDNLFITFSDDPNLKNSKIFPFGIHIINISDSFFDYIFKENLKKDVASDFLPKFYFPKNNDSEEINQKCFLISGYMPMENNATLNKKLPVQIIIKMDEDNSKYDYLTINKNRFKLLFEDCDKTIDAMYNVILNVFVCSLVIINSPKIIDYKHHIFSNHLNRDRIRRNKYPLLEYKTLFLKKEIQLELDKERNNCKNNGSKRLHMRRGHFKQTKNGLFWWKPHLSGVKEKGIIIKDYKV